MNYRELHPWNVSPKEAMQIQTRLRESVLLETTFSEIRTIAGADIAIDREKGMGYSGVIVYSFPHMQEIERTHASVKLTFPYVPGLLVFREGPPLLATFKSLKTAPDLVVFDGQGIAHPRRMGIATHMGLILDKPTIGCAKSVLVGQFEEPGPEVGDYASLMDGDEVIGAALRTRRDVKPVFISQGHKLDLPTAVKVILQCVDGYRIPKPTREADHYVAQVKSGKIAEGGKRQLTFGLD